MKTVATEKRVARHVNRRVSGAGADKRRSPDLSLGAQQVMMGLAVFEAKHPPASGSRRLP